MPPKRKIPSRPIRSNPPRSSPYRKQNQIPNVLPPPPPIPADTPPGSQVELNSNTDQATEARRDLSNVDPRLRSVTATATVAADKTLSPAPGRSKLNLEKEGSQPANATVLPRPDGKGKRIDPTKGSVKQEAERTALPPSATFDQRNRQVDARMARRRARKIIESDEEDEVEVVERKRRTGKVDKATETDTDSNLHSDQHPVIRRATSTCHPPTSTQNRKKRHHRGAADFISRLQSARRTGVFRHSEESLTSLDSSPPDPQRLKDKQDIDDLTLDDSSDPGDDVSEIADNKLSGYNLIELLDYTEVVALGTDVDDEADHEFNLENQSNVGAVRTDCSEAYAAIDRAEKRLANKRKRTRSKRKRDPDETDTNGPGSAGSLGAGFIDRRKMRALPRGSTPKTPRHMIASIERTTTDDGSVASSAMGDGSDGSDYTYSSIARSAEFYWGDSGEGGDGGDGGSGSDPDGGSEEADDDSSSSDEDDLDPDAEIPESPDLDPLLATDLVYTEYALRPGVEITRRHREKLERKVNFQRIIIMLVVRFRNGIKESKPVLDRILYHKHFKDHWDDIMYRTRWAAERLERVSWRQRDATFSTVYKQFTEYEIDPFSLSEDCTGCRRYHEICYSYSDVRLSGVNYNANTFVPEPNDDWRPNYTLGTDCFKSWLEARELYHLVYFRFCEFEQDSFAWERMKPKLRALVSQTPVDIDKIVKIFDKTGMSKKFMSHFDQKIRTAQSRRAELFLADFIQPG